MNGNAHADRPAILLDLDNTLLDFNTAERTALSRALTELGIPFDASLLARYHEINIRHWELLEDGLLTREQVLVQRFRALFDERGIQADAFETQLLYERLLAEGHWFMPGAEELLETLDGKYRLFICSNGAAAVQDGRIRSAGIAPYFEQIFISEHMGCNKPERAFFELCFARIPGFRRDRTMIVGDSLSSDIRGGGNAGLLSCWYNPGGNENGGPVRPDYEIRALCELPPLLAEIFG